jgi:hypothetical protein
MILIKIVEDETMMVRGFERHTYRCSACSDIEERFVFIKHASEGEVDAAPLKTPSSVQNQQAAAQSPLSRGISKTRKL